MNAPLHRLLLTAAIIGLALFAGGRWPAAQQATDAAPELVVFELSKQTVASIELGAEEPGQKLMLVRVNLSDQGTAALRQLTAENIGEGLLIEVPDGRQYGPNRIEKTLNGNRLGLVLPSKAARALHKALR